MKSTAKNCKIYSDRIRLSHQRPKDNVQDREPTHASQERREASSPPADAAASTETGTRTQVLSGADAPLPGKPLSLSEREMHLPGYRFLTVLGSGGMGTVYLALQESLGRHVAIKVIRGNIDQTVAQATNLQDEAHTMALLSHPNVLNCYDIISTDHGLFLVMEYIPGRLTARTLLQRYGSLSEFVILRILTGIVSGLAYIYQKGYIHRDLKPDNTMLFRQDTKDPSEDSLPCDELFRQASTRVVICDFGTAQHLTAILPATHAVGSPMYMAPEQFCADSQLDCRADIYALGSVAYFLLTGQVPFSGTSREELYDIKLTHDIPDPRFLSPDIKPELAHLVLRLGKARPEERYQSYGDILDDLDRLATTDSVWFSSTRRRVSHRALWKGIALGAACALAAQGIWLAHKYVRQEWFESSRISLTQSLGYWRQSDSGSWRVITDDSTEASAYIRGIRGSLPLVLYQPLGTGMVLDFKIRFLGDGSARFGLLDNSDQPILQIRWNRLNLDRETFLQMSSDGQRQLISLGAIEQPSQLDWLHVRLHLQRRSVTITANGEDLGIALLKQPIGTCRFFVRSQKCPIIELKDLYRIVDP